MSKILNRPMFRGGGKVSSYGNGITTGLADGGMPLLVGQHPNSAKGPDGREMHKEVIVGADLMSDNIFSGVPRSKDYLEQEQYFKTYKPKSQEDIARGYEEMMRQKEDDLTMTYGIDDYSGFQDSVAEDLSYYRDPEGGMKKYFQEQKTIDDEARKEATKYNIELPDLINNQLKKDTPEVKTEAQIRAEVLAGLKGKKLTDEEKLAEVEKDQAFFEKLLGGGKAAKIQDASDMAISFASKALGEGATVKSAFADFLADETKRPSRRMKVKDAATQAAIQSYLTGKTSYQKFQDDIASYGTKLEMKDKFDKKDLNIDNVLRAEAGNNGKVTNEGVMARSFDRKYKDVPGYTGFKGEVKPDKELIEGGIYYVTEGNDRIVYIVKNGELEEIKTIFN